MMMPNPTSQRDLWRARRAEAAESHDTERQSAADAAPPASAPTGVRVRVGHALIGAGRWLSGEGADAKRPSRQHRAA
jgi:hypothetical protein